MNTIKLDIELDEEEYYELYAMAKSCTYQQQKHNPQSSNVPIIRMMRKINDFFDKNADLDTQANVSMDVEASIRSVDKNIVAKQNIENGILGLSDSFKEEREGLDDEINSM